MDEQKQVFFLGTGYKHQKTSFGGFSASSFHMCAVSHVCLSGICQRVFFTLKSFVSIAHLYSLGDHGPGRPKAPSSVFRLQNTTKPSFAVSFSAHFRFSLLSYRPTNRWGTFPNKGTGNGTTVGREGDSRGGRTPGHDAQQLPRRSPAGSRASYVAASSAAIGETGQHPAKKQRVILSHYRVDEQPGFHS